MKKSLKTALIAAGLLIVAGVAIVLVALLLGAKPVEYLREGVYTIDTSLKQYDKINSPYSESGVYTVPSAGITELRLDWAAGEVKVESAPGNEIIFTESGRSEALTEKTALRYKVEGNELYIQYLDKGEKIKQEKDLLLTLPEELCESLGRFTAETGSARLLAKSLGADSFDFSSGSGELNIPALTSMDCRVSTASGCVSIGGEAGSLRLSTASGDANVTCSGRTLRADTASGRLTFEGAYERAEINSSSGDISVRGGGSMSSIDCESSSGRITVTGGAGRVEAESSSGEVTVELDNCPSELGVDTASGNVRLILPGDSSFTLEVDTASGAFDSTFALQRHGSTYVAGSGFGDFEIETASGDISVEPAV